MEGKVKCSGCGWSWNKSDSSKKDMYVCHQCGKDNTMKNGGWLNKYDDGGPVQPNYNDASVSMSDDFVGLGYDTNGRNYSPAWGGQFQVGGKLNPISPMQQVQQAVQPTPTVPYLQTKDPAEFYKSWIQSPEYARRQLLTGYSEGEDLYMPNAAASRESRLGAIEEMTPITYSARQPSEAKPGVYGSPSYVNINPSDYVGTSKEAIQAHELAHVAGAMGEVRPGMMSATEQDIFKKSMLPMKEPALSGVQGSKEREASVRALEDFKHSQEPDEAKADLDALRFMMYDKGIYDITKGKKFTETDFQKAKQNLGNDRVFKRLENRMGKKNFVKLMNTIALADDQEEAPIAMGGMSIPGSVGFSYARVAGAAPSKGKYAKKTMASAQTGKNNIKKDATNINTGVANKIAGLELQQNPDYQYFKYLQSLPQLRQAPGRGEELMRKGLGYADVATDVMQMGNFIPHPTAQAVGKVGNIAGMIVDGLQGADEAYRGNYLNAGINLASVALPMFLGSNTFRRNAMNLRPGDPLYSLTQKAGKPYTIDLNKTDTGYLELFSKVKGMKDKSLMYNRAFLGGLGAETAYDAGLIGPVKKEYGGEIPSAQNGIMSPMLLARNVLNYFYPSEEAEPAVEAAPVEYKKGLTNELLQRQAYKESTFNPAAVSPAGYKGLTQIGEGVLKDYSKKKGGKKLNPFNPKDAVELQKFAMDDLYNASFINKPEQSDSVRIAKTLAAYNWGRGNLANYLNEQKSKGVDIYDSYDWLNNLPKETSDYVNKILLQEDPSFNKNYKKASTNPKYEEVTSLYDQKKFGGDIPSAQNGEEDIKTIDLPEIVVTAYDEEYPFYQSLSNEQKKYINDEGPIGRATRALAKTGKRGQTAKDISKVVKDVEKFGFEATGVPGTSRFVGDPLAKLTGTGKTLLDLGLTASPFGIALGGVNPITGEQMFNEQNLQGAFDTLDALGMVGGATALLKQPVQKGFQLGSKAVGNIVNRSITPIGYDPFTVAAAPLELITPNALKFKPKTFATKNRFDAWRLYNGLDPEFNTFSKNPDGTLAINDFRLWKDDLQKIVDNPKESFGTMEIQREYNFGGVHGNGWISKGVDEEGRKFIDFTDTWDLQPFAAFSKLPEKIRNFEVSSLSGGKPFDLKNRIYYDDKGNFFDHGGNKLAEEVQHFPKGVVKQNEAVDLTMLSTPNVAGTNQIDVLKDWNNATNHKFIKGGLTSGIGVASGASYLAARAAKKRLKEDEKKGDDAVKEFQNGGEMRFYQNGLDWKPKSMREGGIIKDNQGYLNPNNFGKVVEIDSNDITMEGVYEPLLGVSDTGDTKLMKPGKNYKFKGKKVTEYPVAKLGINQLDAQPMKKLNQLLNFTNNPDKDNWLDKYN